MIAIDEDHKDCFVVYYYYKSHVGFFMIDATIIKADSLGEALEKFHLLMPMTVISKVVEPDGC